ncbi:MAG: lysylphosphatidylglycerol synthase transmembrane domain-containing protein [Mycoplasmatota bacterium]
MNKKLIGKVKSKLNIIILIFITLLVLYFSLKDDYQTIINNILSINKYWFLVSILCLLLSYVLKIFIMRNLVRKFKKKYQFKKASTIVLSTQFFNAVTPFASGGQPFQIYTLNQQGIKISQASNVTIQYSIITQISLIIVSTIAIILNNSNIYIHQDTILNKLIILGYTVNVVVIAVLFLLAFGKNTNSYILKLILKILKKLKLVKNYEDNLVYWNKNLTEFHKSAEILLKNKFDFLRNIFLCVLALIILYSIPYFLALAMSLDISLVASVTITSYVMLIGSFIPIPGGTGGIEYGFVQFFSVLVTGAHLSSLLILWRFITYYLGMIIGAIAFNIQRRD